MDDRIEMTLARREKFLVALAGGMILLLFIFHFLILPFLEEKKRMEHGVKTREAALQELELMTREYQSLKQKDQGLKNILSRRNKGVTLFSFLEKEAQKADIKGHIKYMKPSVLQSNGPYKESMVEMKLEGITLKQLVEYIYRIESPRNAIVIKRISIKENKKKSGRLNAVLQVLMME